MESLTVFVLSFLLTVCSAIELDLTLEVMPAKKECLYQPISKGVAVDVEYQVVDGGDLDVNFVVKNPNGQVMITDVRKTENYHKFTAQMDGDFQFCIDNSFSRFSDKVVFFELMTDEEDELTDLNMDYDMESNYEMKIEDFRKYADTIGKNLDTSMSTIRTLKSLEARDRNIAEDNYSRVNFWSGVQVFIMVSVSLTQVLMIKSLFLANKAGAATMKVRT